jgi:hypothetical protein
MTVYTAIFCFLDFQQYMLVFLYLDLFKFWEFVNYQFIYRIFGCDRKENKGNPRRGVSPRLKNLTQWPWPWKSIGFQTHLRTKYIPSSVKIYWRMLILERSQGCYTVILTFDLWPWKSTGFQILLKTKHVPSLTKIHWRMLILVFTR